MTDFEVRHPLLLLNVRRSYLEGVDLYETARWAWRVDAGRAADRTVLMHVGGVVVGVFSTAEWLPVTTSNRFPVDSPGRLGFVGAEAERALVDQYMDRTVPERFLGRNPVRYCDP